MKILILSTWFPYPLNQGSTIRAYHLIRALAEQHATALVSFEHQPLQPAWLVHMREMCERVDVVRRRPFARSRAKSALGWLSPRPSAVVGAYSAEMAARVQQVAAEWQPDLVFALTFVTAPYALQVPGVRRVVDVDNLTGQMLAEAYQAARHPLERARRYLAFRKFQRYESELFRQFDLCLVVSERDRATIGQTMPLRPEQVGLVPNGVDLDHYRPVTARREPGALVYSGALTYDANYDAVQHFLAQIFPRIRTAAPEATLTVTGSTAGVDVAGLGAGPGVRFTGYVDDIRSVVGQSAACVVPLRRGAGTRLKILEAMALGTPVVSTTKGAEGLAVVPGEHLLIGDTPEAFAAQTAALLRAPEVGARLSQQALERVRERYGWDRIRANFECQVARLAPVPA